MTITISSGVVSSGLTISSGNPLVVLSGGTVEYSTVAEGGLATMSAGAVGVGLTVSVGGVLQGPGLLEGYDGVAGEVSGASLADDGFLELLSGGTARGVTVTAPSTEPYSYFEIDYGATATGTDADDAFVQVYGTALGTRIDSGGDEDVFPEGHAKDDTVESGGRLVLSGGKDEDAVVLSGGLLVLSGGEAESATVDSGGALGFGGALRSDFVAGPVAATTAVRGVTVSSGGVLDLYGATVVGGVTLSLPSGTVGDDLTVAAGAVVEGPGSLTGETEVGGTISGVSIGGILELEDGAAATSVTAGGDSSLLIDAGALASGVVAQSGALVNDLGTAFGVVVDAKAEAYVNTGGVASAVTVLSGGVELVYSGGAASSGVVGGGGLLLLQGGTASGAVVCSGGAIDVEQVLTADVTAGVATGVATISGVTVSSGATIELDDATVAAGATVSVASRAVVSGLQVDSGGAVMGAGYLVGFTQDSGSLSGVTIGDAGDAFNVLFVLSGGVLSGVTADPHSQIDFDAGATGTGVTVLSGAEFDDAGAAASVAVVAGGVLLGSGDLLGVDKVAGSVTGVTLASGGVAELAAGGTASGVTVTGAGGAASHSEFEIESGGAAVGTVVEAGGRQVVKSGGVASGAAISSGGLEYLYSGGVDSSTVVESGGREVLLSGGYAIGLGLGAGGEVVDDGEVRVAGDGTLAGILEGSGAVIEIGGGDLLLSSYGDRDFAGKAVISGGTIELATVGALGSGYVEFVEPATGSAVLQIDAADAPKAGGTFANTISNFDGANEDIDLTSIAYVAGASATLTGGKLVLSDGGKTYSFTVAGATAGAYPVLSDGDGGTLIDPQVVAMTHAMAAFTAPSAAGATPISRTSSSAETPFLHATGSAGAGHL